MSAIDENSLAPLFELSRRSFICTIGAAGVLLVQNQLAAAVGAPVGPGWSDGPGRARHRIEGVAKVTGQKIYARDFRAADMPGWPGNECVALVLRASEVGRTLLATFLEERGARSASPRRIRAHRWRHAQGHLPEARGALVDLDARLAVCGDWVNGSRVEDALTSGVTAAERLLGLGPGHASGT